MNANDLFYCISKAMNDPDTARMELVGYKHEISLNPEKVIDVMTRNNCLWITKRIFNDGIDQLLINPDHIIFLRIVKDVKNNG